ncbi:MAG TPA: serine hydrolase [Pseudolabrys sp.]|nr:serine hydrolase [Pseudolabrys sp.]
MAVSVASSAQAQSELAALVAREIKAVLPENGAGGAAVAVRTGGHTQFFNYGYAELAHKRPMNEDALVNIASVRKVFEATLLAQAVERGELKLDDPVDRYVTELKDGHDIRRVTVGQLATHTSGLLLPQDHPPWPTQGYSLAEFIKTLNDWQADAEQQPGKQHMYTHAGYVLLQLALERALKAPIKTLLETRIIKPLGLTATRLPMLGEDGRADLPPALLKRAVQGYDEDGQPVGAPGDQQTYYHFPGTGQMYSSARDLARFAAAQLGEVRVDPPLGRAMQLARQRVVDISPRNAQALAWEINYNDTPPIVEKNGGMNNASSYVGLIPERRLAIVILCNRGDQDVASVGRRILWALAKRTP